MKFQLKSNIKEVMRALDQEARSHIDTSIRAELQAILCPVHNERIEVTSHPTNKGLEYRIKACCSEAVEEARKRFPQT